MDHEESREEHQFVDQDRDRHPGSNVETKIDGVQIIASTWDFVFPMKNVRISSPLFVKREKTRSVLKGTRHVRDSDYIWSIYLFESCDLTIKVIFWGDFDSLAYDQLVKLMYKSIDQSIAELPDSNTSKCVLQKVRLGNKRTKKDVVKIMCCDYSNIGAQLSRNIRTNLHTMFHDPVYFAFLGVCMGQNMNSDYMSRKLGSLNSSCMLEILLHHAYDCTYFDKLLLWRRDGIVVQMNGCHPSYEYYPVAIPNHGNFYYNKKMTTLNPDTASHVTSWKCYGENSKHVHDGRTKPFHKSEVANFIMEFTSTGFLAQTVAAKKRYHETARLYLAQTEILDELLQSARDHRLNSARIEFIVSTVAPRVLAHEPSEFPVNFVVLSRTAALEYCNFYQLISDGTLSVLDPNLIFIRYNQYFPGICYLLRKHLMGVLEYLSDPLNFFEFTFDDYLSVVAAEAVASFLLYGTSVSTSTPRHNNRLCRDLGIVGHKFRQAQDNLASCSFGKNVLDVLNDGTQVQFTYHPKFDWTCLLDNIRKPVSMSRIVQCCSARTPNYLAMAKLLLDVLVHSSLALVNASTHVLAIYRTNIYSNFYENSEYKSSFELCQFLFTMNSHQAAGHFGLLWLIQHVLRLLKTRKRIYKFKLYFAKYLDGILYQENTYFVISFPNRRVTIFTIPFLQLMLEPNRNTQLTKLLQLYRIKFWRREKEEPHAGLRGFLTLCKSLSEGQLIGFEKINSSLQRIHTISKSRLFVDDDITAF